MGGIMIADVDINGNHKDGTDYTDEGHTSEEKKRI